MHWQVYIKSKTYQRRWLRWVSLGERLPNSDPKSTILSTCKERSGPTLPTSSTYVETGSLWREGGVREGGREGGGEVGEGEREGGRGEGGRVDGVCVLMLTMG